MVEYKQTDNLTDRLEYVTEIWYQNTLFGFKFMERRWRDDRIHYRLICDLDTIEKCEKKFGYGWKFADCGFEIYPEDGKLTIEQIETELIPQVIKFIIETEGYVGKEAV